MRIARVAGKRLDPVEIDETLVVEGELPLANAGVLVQPLQLDEGDGGEHVGEVGLEPRRSSGRREPSPRRVSRIARIRSATLSRLVLTSPPSPAATFFVA